jgi:hypothetical protein
VRDTGQAARVASPAASRKASIAQLRERGGNPREDRGEPLEHEAEFLPVTRAPEANGEVLVDGVQSRVVAWSEEFAASRS